MIIDKMSKNKITFSIYLGILNIIFCLVPILMISLFGFLGLAVGVILLLACPILCLILVPRMYKKIFLDAKMLESVIYSSLILFSWFFVFFILMEYTGLLKPNGFISLGMLTLLVCCLNVLFVII